ncbi:unnamed protein product [Cyprideis torosa]|uniref:Uncharacterized protein n=1 Tax=Cyprideis torosa TaxID=163714 RepID=A0A7R8WIZ4_9CRUS|nr:unnamed protein product [Cyprideis torosa]CAG0895067.1 unnamed protein product [Cyprideis torosa]
MKTVVLLASLFAGGQFVVMVKLKVKRKDALEFVLETTLNVAIEELLKEVVQLYNARQSLLWLCSEVESLANHGSHLPPEMVGLLDEQIEELGLKDEHPRPSGGWVSCPDEMRRRNGRAPVPKMADLLRKSVQEVRALLDPNSGPCLTKKRLENGLDVIRGAVMIAYPMELPECDPIRQELQEPRSEIENQAEEAQLWFASKRMLPGNRLRDHLRGANESTTAIVKLTTSSKEGPPMREPSLTEEQQKQLMLQQYRRQQEWKELEEVEESGHLHEAMHGLSKIRFKP